MLVLGIETSCDETGLAVYDTGRGLLAHALHSQVAMHGALRRRRARARVARPRAARRAPRAARAGRSGGRAARARRHRLHAGSGARGRAAGRRERRQRARLRARQARRSACITWKAICSRRCWPIRSPGFRSSRCSCPAVTASCSKSRASGATGCSATPRTTPRARRSTRRPSCSDSAYPGGPALAGLAESGRDGAVVAAAADARERRPRHELQRAQDRRADARAPRRGRRDARRRAPGRHRARVPARGRRRPRGEGDRGAGRDGTRAARRGRGRGRQSRAARAARRRGRRARRTGVLPGSRVLHGQRRDDRAGRRVAPCGGRALCDWHSRSGRAGTSRRFRRPEHGTWPRSCPGFSARSCAPGRRAVAGCSTGDARTAATRSGPSPTPSERCRRRRRRRPASAPRW